MKQFENKLTGVFIELKKEEGVELKELTYADFAIMCINAPKDPRTTKIANTTSQIGRDLKVLYKLEEKKAGDVIELSDQEHTTLIEHVNEMSHWPTRHKSIVEFDEYIKGLETVEGNEE